MLQAVLEKLQGHRSKKQQILQVMLANLASGLKCDDICVDECRVRLGRAVATFNARRYQTPDRFYSLLLDEMQANSEGWYTRQPNLTAHMDDLLLCVADHWGLAAWMNAPGSGLYKDADQAAKACETLNDLLDSDDDDDPRLKISIGKPADGEMPARPLWLTPFHGELASLIDDAATEPSPRLANRMCAALGLSHISLGSPVIAVVLDATVTTLSEDGGPRIAGPTSLEAGGFKHYRHYPNPRAGTVDGFGRTYELNAAERSRADERKPFGAPEAVRPPMVVRDALEFVYIGQTAVEPNYDRKLDAGFLSTVGADASLATLMETIGRAVNMWEHDEG